ncbi:hypothetical protein KVR01_009111 [Diaporthe batatas]|uniref:uncharacterized protein n=1 Tax=Diaporthe batatas TaxID=748121 RepID=UPI001D055F1F|nr:uncharacterized protein KVR01_009111 [Diaporthe batatas]KAG8160847.1 hypothetical protein KVR01_009111 [Diaporthe batatas]
MDGQSESSPRPTRLFSYNIYVYKKPDMDEASHHDHIQKVNTPIIKALLEKYGAVAYTVTHNDASARADFDRLFPEAPAGMLLDYDTVISMITPNIECIEKMRQDPDFLVKFIPDHFNFADMTQSRCIVGWAEYYHFK